MSRMSHGRKEQKDKKNFFLNTTSREVNVNSYSEGTAIKFQK